MMPLALEKDYRDLLIERNKQGAKYLIVGGYAVSVYSEPRATKDIDLLHEIDGVSFDEAWENRVETLMDGDTPAFVISIEDLLKNKLSSGRRRDLLDVEAIRESAATAKKGR